MDELNVLGNSEEEILTTICRCAARYVTGEARPPEELATQKQREESVKMQQAIYTYLNQHIN